MHEEILLGIVCESLFEIFWKILLEILRKYSGKPLYRYYWKYWAHNVWKSRETKGKALQFCWRLVETVPRFEPFPLLQFSLSTTNAKLFSTLEPLFQFRIKRGEWIDLYFFFSKAFMCFAMTFILSQFERMFGRMQLLHLETKLPHLYLFSKAHQKWLHFFKLFSFFWSNLKGS